MLHNSTSDTLIPEKTSDGSECNLSSLCPGKPRTFIATCKVSSLSWSSRDVQNGSSTCCFQKVINCQDTKRRKWIIPSESTNRKDLDEHWIVSPDQSDEWEIHFSVSRESRQAKGSQESGADSEWSGQCGVEKFVPRPANLGTLEIIIRPIRKFLLQSWDQLPAVVFRTRRGPWETGPRVGLSCEEFRPQKSYCHHVIVGS